MVSCRSQAMATSRSCRKPEVTFATSTNLNSNTAQGSSTASAGSNNSTNSSNKHHTNQQSKSHQQDNDDEKYLPNNYQWRKLENLIERMQDEYAGIPVRNYKSFLTTIPSVFTGADLISWVMQQLDIDDIAEAVHLTSTIASIGYLFPIDDHVLAVKNDHSFLRFQTPCLYPSRCVEADGVDYAVYLSKRTMQNKQRLELTDFEAERLARLQSLYCHKWEFIYLQAESEAKVDKKRDKFERLVLESQERAYWDVHRPVPGYVNTTEIDMRKLCRAKRPKKTPNRPTSHPVGSGPGGQLIFNGIDNLPVQDRLVKFNALSERTRIKASKAADSLISYYDQYSAFDMLLPLVNCTNSSSGGSNTSSTGATGPGGAATVTAAGGAGQPGPHSAMGQLVSGANAAPGSTGTAGSSNSSVIPLHQVSPNPWISDSVEFWEAERRVREVPIRRVRRWGFSVHELLLDPAGKLEFQRWLEREFSAENLRFWEACQEIKGAPLRELPRRIREVYDQFLAFGAVDAINVDSRVSENVRNKVERSSGSNPDRYCFEEAEEHIFRLMKSDSYHRFLRSEFYKDMLAGQKKKSKKKFPPESKQKSDID